MRVLLTGATGFIGSHLFAKLVELNIPTAVILRENANTWRIKNHLHKAVIIRGDLTDVQRIEQPILDFKPDILIHLAWYGVENKYRNQYEQIICNLNCIPQFLEVLEKTNIKKIIGFGSQAEYGPCSIPIDEEMMPNPTTYYGVAKLCAYQIMKLFCEQKMIDFTWIRVFSIYGPMDNDSWLIPYVIKELLNGNSPSLTEGKQLWDFLHVDDAVNAIVAVMMNPNEQGIFNLGCGEAITIRSVVERIRDNIDSSIKLGFGLIPYRADQVMFLEAKIDRIKKTTGWNSQVSFEKGIQNTIAWYKQA